MRAGRNAREAEIQTITGLFDSYEHAQKAVQLLDQAGIHQADISLVSHAEDQKSESGLDEDVVGEDVTVGGEIGAGLGAAGGLLAGLGIVAIPGFGAVVAGGWLIATGAGIGAATGSFVCTLTQAGVAEHDAHVIAESVRRGGAVVSARVDDRHVVAATAILRHAEGADLAARRDAYQREGWQGFVEKPDEPAAPSEPVPPPA